MALSGGRKGMKYFQQTGREGGLKVASKMTPEQRTERARKAALAMHAKRKAKNND